MRITFGITPAYAGKSACGFRCAGSHWDHPRLCGEKPLAARWGLAAPGSPPPMRGKVLFWIPPILGGRITPAYAGKSDAYDNLLNYT